MMLFCGNESNPEMDQSWVPASVQSYDRLSLLDQFQDVLENQPGWSTTTEHQSNSGHAVLVHPHPYQ